MNYTTKDLRFIRENIDLTDSELAEKLGRTRAGIQGLRMYNGIIKKRWITDEDKEVVRDNIHLKDSEIAALIDRTPGAIKAIRLSMNLRRWTHTR